MENKKDKWEIRDKKPMASLYKNGEKVSAWNYKASDGKKYVQKFHTKNKCPQEIIDNFWKKQEKNQEPKEKVIEDKKELTLEQLKTKINPIFTEKLFNEYCGEVGLKLGSDGWWHGNMLAVGWELYLTGNFGSVMNWMNNEYMDQYDKYLPNARKLLDWLEKQDDNKPLEITKIQELLNTQKVVFDGNYAYFWQFGIDKFDMIKNTQVGCFVKNSKYESGFKYNKIDNSVADTNYYRRAVPEIAILIEDQQGLQKKHIVSDKWEFHRDGKDVQLLKNNTIQAIMGQTQNRREENIEFISNMSIPDDQHERLIGELDIIYELEILRENITEEFIEFKAKTTENIERLQAEVKTLSARSLQPEKKASGNEDTFIMRIEECAILIAEAAALEEQHEAEINKQGELRREAHNRVVEKSKKIKKIIENENKKKSEHEDMKRYTREALEAYKATQKAPKDLTYRQ